MQLSDRAIVAGVKAGYPDVPDHRLSARLRCLGRTLRARDQVDAIGCDTSMPLAYMCETLQSRLPVQGNLDPLLLVAGGVHLERRVRRSSIS